MNIDFNRVIKALKEINYEGYFTLEATRYLDKYEKDNVLDGLIELKKSAKKLCSMFDDLNEIKM